MSELRIAVRVSPLPMTVFATSMRWTLVRRLRIISCRARRISG